MTMATHLLVAHLGCDVQRGEVAVRSLARAEAAVAAVQTVQNSFVLS